MGALVGMALAACGSVPMDGDGVDAGVDAPGSTVKAYQGALAMSPASMFGGMGTYVCVYSITLRQIQLNLTTSTTGQVTGGTAQNTTDEKVVNTADCPFTPALPTTQKFTFKSATPVGASTMIVMEGDAANSPKTTLAITLSPTGTGYTAGARWVRTDQVAELTWTVTANIPVIAK